MSEEWRSVVGYEGLYEVSDAGRVRRCANTARCRMARLVIGGLSDVVGIQRLHADGFTYKAIAAMPGMPCYKVIFQVMHGRHWSQRGATT